MDSSVFNFSLWMVTKPLMPPKYNVWLCWSTKDAPSQYSMTSIPSSWPYSWKVSSLGLYLMIPLLVLNHRLPSLSDCMAWTILFMNSLSSLYVLIWLSFVYSTSPILVPSQKLPFGSFSMLKMSLAACSAGLLLKYIFDKTSCFWGMEKMPYPLFPNNKESELCKDVKK